MTDWAQLFLESNVADAAVASAVARVLSLAAAQVRVVPGPSERSVEAWQDTTAQAVVVRNTLFDLAGEHFPVLLELQTRDAIDVTPDMVRALGAALHTPFVTNVGGDPEGYRWSLVLPDGEMRTVRLDDDDQFVLTLDDVRAMERSRVPAHRAA